jgi:hypothetical protein
MGRSPELWVDSGELGTVRREYGRGHAAPISAGAVHGRAWTGAGGRQPRSSTWHIASAPVLTPIGSKSS